MVIGVVVALVGIVMVLSGGAVTRRKVKAEYGQVDEYTMRMSSGTGVVPNWVSFVVLGGYLVAIAGGVAAFASR